jgi:hypothetical protein
MKLTFPNRIMLAMLLLVSLAGNANDLGALPHKLRFHSPDFLETIVSYDREYNKKLVTKVCACQLLTVKNKNREIDNVAVFSEKINNGDLSADFEVAVKVLEQEKKHMKSFFYDKVTVIGKQVVATDCKTFYRQLKVQYTDLKMYELLDADAISRFNNLNK